MSEGIIFDLRYVLREFVADAGDDIVIPEYVKKEVVNLVFDVLIFELEDIHEEPDLTRLGNFYHEHLKPNPDYVTRFLESFFLLVKAIAERLKAHDLYSGNGFEYAPVSNRNNRSIVVKKFDNLID